MKKMLLVIVLSLFMFACETETVGENKCMKECTQDSDCGGLSCVSQNNSSGVKYCASKNCESCGGTDFCNFNSDTCGFSSCDSFLLRSCNSDSDCGGSDLYCGDKNQCIPTECKTCAGAEYCVLSEGEFSYCKDPNCLKTCLGDSDCGSGKICMDTGSGSKKCVPSSCNTCASYSKCMFDYDTCSFSYCKDSTCMNSCTSSSDCGAGQYCPSADSGYPRKCIPESCGYCDGGYDFCSFSQQSCSFNHCEECKKPCSDDSDCPLSGYCGNNICLSPKCRECHSEGKGCYVYPNSSTGACNFGMCN